MYNCKLTRAIHNFHTYRPLGVFTKRTLMNKAGPENRSLLLLGGLDNAIVRTVKVTLLQSIFVTMLVTRSSTIYFAPTIINYNCDRQH